MGFTIATGSDYVGGIFFKHNIPKQRHHTYIHGRDGRTIIHSWQKWSDHNTFMAEMVGPLYIHGRNGRTIIHSWQKWSDHYTFMAEMVGPLYIHGRNGQTIIHFCVEN